jgi:hypothetical protein
MMGKPKKGHDTKYALTWSFFGADDGFEPATLTLAKKR